MIFASMSGIALQGPQDVNDFKSLALSTMFRAGNRAAPRRTQRLLGASTMWGALEVLAQPQEANGEVRDLGFESDVRIYIRARGPFHLMKSCSAY